jgi:quercetin dioxygenase-like cupin family protein
LSSVIEIRGVHHTYATDGMEVRALDGVDAHIVPGISKKWSSSNSVVRSLPALRVEDSLGGDLQEVGASLVAISGPSDEPLHYHSSHLIGVVTSGRGWFCVPGEGGVANPVRQEVVAGDVVVIPRSVLHLFDCDPGGQLDYVSLEFSDKAIDYQKHWRE